MELRPMVRIPVIFDKQLPVALHCLALITDDSQWSPADCFNALDDSLSKIFPKWRRMFIKGGKDNIPEGFNPESLQPVTVF